MKHTGKSLILGLLCGISNQAYAVPAGEGTSFNPVTGVSCHWRDTTGTISVPGKAPKRITNTECFEFSEQCVAHGGAPLNCRVICIGIYLDTDNDRIPDVFLKADGQFKPLD